MSEFPPTIFERTASRIQGSKTYKSAMGLSERLGRTNVGRQFKQGIAESFGWQYEKGQNFGFLGRKVLGEAGKGMSLGTKALNIGGGVLGVAGMTYSAYTGYQEGGIFGAAKEMATSSLMWGTMRAGVAAVGGLTGGILVGGAIAGAAGYAFGENAQGYAKRMRGIEMGAPIVDPFGTAASMRQRSLNMLQRTHINGRMALSNEGVLMHENAYSFRR